MAHAQSICHAAPKVHTQPRWLFAHLRSLIQEWRRRAGSRYELAVLCDRCLRDIGVTRYDAYHEVRKPFWRA